MPLEELYQLLKGKLKRLYDHNEDTVVLEQKEFFAVYKVVCDLMQIKHITESN